MNPEKWWQDDPRGSMDDDALLRGPFVRRVVKVLDAVHQDASSTVLGLVGPWGSGKTTLINFVRSQLNAAEWSTVDFTPWATNSREDLVVEFLACLASATEGRTERDYVAKRRRETLRALAVPALAAIPSVGTSASGVAAYIEGRMARPIGEQLQELAEALPESGPATLIVVDDVDRLQPGELLTMFQMIRLLGRLPRVHYLIAYDEETLLATLASSSSTYSTPQRALAYLEKMVQLKLDIPPLAALDADRMLSSGLLEVLEEGEHDLTDDDVDRYRKLYRQVFSRTLLQPREIRRFLAQVSTYLPLLSHGEVDLMDFLGLTHLRSEAPWVYRLVQHEGVALASMGKASHDERVALRQEWEKRIAEVAHPTSATDAWLWPLLEELFPRLRTVPDDDVDSWVEDQNRRSSIRVANPEYFSRYFAFGIPVDDVADAMSKHVLQQIVDSPESEWSGIAGRVFTSMSPAERATDVRGLSRDDAERDARLLKKFARFSLHFDASSLVLLFEFAVSEASQLADSASLLGSPKSAALDWSIAIVGALQAYEPVTIDETQFVSRIAPHIEFACRSLRVPEVGEARGAVEALVWRVAKIAVTAALTHLDQGDEAPEDFDFDLVVRFILASPERERFSEVVSQKLTEDGSTAAALVARFVAVVTTDDRAVSGMVGLRTDTLEAVIPLEEILKHLDDVPTVARADDVITWETRKAAGASEVMRIARDRKLQPPEIPREISQVLEPDRAWDDVASRMDLTPEFEIATLRLRAIATFSLDGDSGDLPDAVTREEQLKSTMPSLPLSRWPGWIDGDTRSPLDTPWEPRGVNRGSVSELVWHPREDQALVGHLYVDTDFEPRQGIAAALAKRRDQNSRNVAAALSIGLTLRSGSDDGSGQLRLAEFVHFVRDVASTATAVAESVVLSVGAGILRAPRLILEVATDAPGFEGVIDFGGLDVVAGGHPETKVVVAVELPPGDEAIPLMQAGTAKQVGLATARYVLEGSQRRGFVALLHGLAERA